MVGYSSYKDISIRHRGNSFDVPIGTVPYLAFVNFDTLDEAKAFISAGRVVTTQVVRDMGTNAPVAA